VPVPEEKINMRDIAGLDLEGLKNSLGQWKVPGFHARQILGWIYQKGVIDFEKMSDLPQVLRERLKDNFSVCDMELVCCDESSDGTRKYLFKLRDGNTAEAVLIPTPDRVTGCISSQVGCKFKCAFCASGMLGFKRNLEVAEIMGEVLYLKNNSPDGRLTHIVFMGTGEPMENYDNVLKAIRIINAEYGLNIGIRRITISTSGIIPGIKRLSEEGLQVELSVSLHCPDDKTRSKLMPVNKVYPLRELMDACREYISRTNRQVTFEYVLIKNVNSDIASADKLSKLLSGLNCKVNLIPSNSVKAGQFLPPNKSDILLFRDRLAKSGTHVTLRKSRGQDIDAACGQLRLRYEKE
jgi:23S rRNA (adenine2503-C2)-methyltransferase